MAIDTSVLFGRLGKLIGIVKAQVDARSALVDRVNGTGSYSGVGLDGQYTAATRYMIAPLLQHFLSITSASNATITRTAATAANTLIEMVHSDNPNTQKQLLPALQELNRQMRSGTPVNLYKNIVTQGSPSYSASNVGTGKILLHSIPSQMSPSETLRFECVGDTTTGSVAGRESFVVTGGARVTDLSSSLWPGGSGARQQTVSSDYTEANLMTNGGFDSWTGGTPDGWTVSGPMTQLSSGVFRGGSAIQHSGVSDGSVSQTSPSAVLGAGRRVICGFWAKKVSGGTPTRDLELEVHDQDANVILTITANPLTTSWQLFTGSFQSDYFAPPSGITMSFLSETDTGIVKAADCAFAFVPQQFGVNGQWCKIVGGSTDWRIGDYATVAVTNNYQSNILSYTERLFSPFERGVELPTATPGDITNSVIP